ncbi:MAG: hypothetical protein JW912_07840 [Sedimentisphaerales bacterium]|nr:hypothetical protein [Sedimentisphaerales bacterium]
MKFISKHFKVLVLSVVMIICVVTNTHAADDPMMKMLPDDCLFCVRINDLNGSLAQIDQYLSGISPVGAAMLVNKELADLVGDPMLRGVEMNGTFAMVGLSDMTAGMLVPVSNYAEFVKNNPNDSKTKEGITVFRSDPNLPDIFATSQISEQYALVVPGSEKSSLVKLKAALVNVSSPLGEKLSESQAKEAAAASVWIYVNIASLYDQFSPIALNELDTIQQEMPKEMTGSIGDLVTLYFKVYLEMFKQLGGDADSVTVALTPEMTSLSIDTTFRAKSGSELAQMLVTNPKADGTFKFAGYLDNSNAINGLMKVDQQGMTKMYDKVFDILEKCNDNPELAEQIAKMKSLTHKTLAATGDEVALSFSYAAGKPPFKVREVIAVKDMDAMKQYTNECIDLADDLYAAMGMPINFEYKTDVETYKNATIDKMVLTFPPSDDPNNPMQAAMQEIYGGDLVYGIAHSADRYYIALGEGSEADMKALIDQDASAALTGETKAAIDMMGKASYNDFVYSVNVVKLIAGMGEFMQSMGSMMQEMDGSDGASMPDIFSGLYVNSQSSIAIGGKIADGQIRTRTVLPKQHLMEIFNTVMQIAMKQSQQMMQESIKQQKTPETTVNNE